MREKLPEAGLSGEMARYPLRMTNGEPFDLPAFMLSHFNRVDFGGNLFGQWPVGIRFEIGIEQVSRAARLYEFAFAKADNFILVSQDWTEGEEVASPSSPLFATPGILLRGSAQFESIEVSPFDETPYRLTWARLSPSVLDASLMFQAIANREQNAVPKISSGVFVIDPRARVIMHMYDDRGLDIIAADISTLRSMFETFEGWILEDQRHRITFRFRTTFGESSV